MVKVTPLIFLALGAPLLAVHGGTYSSVASASASLPSSGSSAYSLASDSASKSVYGSSSDSLSGSTYKSSSGSVPGSASEEAPSGSSSMPVYGTSSAPASGSSSEPSSGSKESAYESPSGSSAGSADCTFDSTVPAQCDGSDNWWPVSVVGKGTYCTQGPVCAGTEGTNCPVPQNGLDFGSQCIVLSKESGVRGCIPRSYCGEILPEPEVFYSESGSQDTTPEVQAPAPETTPSATPSAKCDVDLEATVSPVPTYPSSDAPAGSYETPTPTETAPTAYGDTKTTETPAYSDATPIPSHQGSYGTDAPSSSSEPVDSAPASGSAYSNGSDENRDDYSAGSEGSVYYSKAASASSSTETYPVEDTAAPSTDPIPAYGNARSLRQGN